MECIDIKKEICIKYELKMFIAFRTEIFSQTYKTKPDDVDGIYIYLKKKFVSSMNHIFLCNITDF